MKNHFSLIDLPFKLIFGIVGFLVWEVFSSRAWKRRPRLGTCPAGYWQNQAQWEAHQNRVMEEKHRRQNAENSARYEEELRKREREIRRLHSRSKKR